MFLFHFCIFAHVTETRQWDIPSAKELAYSIMEDRNIYRSSGNRGISSLCPNMPLHTGLRAPGPKGITGPTGTKTTPITTVHLFGVPCGPNGKDTKYVDGFESELAQKLAFGSIFSGYLGERFQRGGVLLIGRLLSGRTWTYSSSCHWVKRPQSFCWGRLEFMRERSVEDARGEC